MDSKLKKCSIKRVQRNDGKWNLQNKETNEYISEIWFDEIGIWSSFSRVANEEHDIFGWNGLLYLEKPIKTDKSAYPYAVKAKIYQYSSEGDFLRTDESVCGIWDNEKKNK